MAQHRRVYRRGSYTEAGFTGVVDFSISPDPAGSRRDIIRGMNKRAYLAESPEPPLQTHIVKRKKKMSLRDRIVYEVKRDAVFASLFVILLIATIFLNQAFVTKIIENIQIRLETSTFAKETQTRNRLNEELESKLNLARNEYRIRNYAQNEMGMLRRERADRQTISIRLPDENAVFRKINSTSSKVELLDVLLQIMEWLNIE